MIMTNLVNIQYKYYFLWSVIYLDHAFHVQTFQTTTQNNNKTAYLSKTRH